MRDAVLVGAIIVLGLWAAFLAVDRVEYTDTIPPLEHCR